MCRPALLTTILMMLIAGIGSARADDLVLNGAAVFSQLSRDYYLGGLWLPQRSSSPDYITSADTARRMQLVVLAEHWSPRNWSRLWQNNIFINNESGSLPADVQQGLMRFTRLLRDDLKQGDEIRIEYQPAGNTRVLLNREIVAASPGPALFNALLNTWIGQRPPSREFRRHILGEGDSAARQRYFQRLYNHPVPLSRLSLFPPGRLQKKPNARHRHGPPPRKNAALSSNVGNNANNGHSRPNRQNKRNRRDRKNAGQNRPGHRQLPNNRHRKKAFRRPGMLPGAAIYSARQRWRRPSGRPRKIRPGIWSVKPAMCWAPVNPPTRWRRNSVIICNCCSGAFSGPPARRWNTRAGPDNLARKVRHRLILFSVVTRPLQTSHHEMSRWLICCSQNSGGRLNKPRPVPEFRTNWPVISGHYLCLTTSL